MVLNYRWLMLSHFQHKLSAFDDAAGWFYLNFKVELHAHWSWQTAHARGAAQQHPGLLLLSAAHHCSGCRRRWDDGDHMPMVLRPCLHQVCRACEAGAGDSCPVCHADTEGSPLEDDAFWAALSTGRLALPPWEVLQDPHQQRRTAAHRLKGDLDLCIDAICALCAWLLRHPDTRDERWADSPLRPRVPLRRASLHRRPASAARRRAR